MNHKHFYLTEFKVEINRDLEGRYQVAVDGLVRIATHDEQRAIDFARALAPKDVPPDEELGRRLGRAIGRSGL